MSRYTFTFKKDNIFVEFTTADKDVVERQFQIWVADADNYARTNKAKSAEAKQEPTTPSAEKSVEPQKEEPEPAAEQAPVVEEIQEINIEETTTEDETEVAPLSEENTSDEPILEKASSLLRTINTIQQEDVVEPEISKETEAIDFDVVLEKTIENPTFEPEKTKDQVFLNLINSKATTDKFHYLIITAYYLLEFEKLDRFSLKQINAKLMQNLSTVIDHTMLQEAINQNLVELIPDLTGISGVGEYRLTAQGEDFFANQI